MERGLFAPTKQALAWNRLTMNLGLMAWLAIGIAVCGLLSFSFVRNLGIIRSVPQEFINKPAITGEISADTAYLERFKISIQKIEEKNRSWWMPSFGLTESRKVEKLLKSQYCRAYDSMVLKPYDTQLASGVVNVSASGDEALVGRYAIYIVSRMIMVRTKLSGDLNAEDMPKYVLSIPEATSADESKKVSELYFWRLFWEDDNTVLEKEMKTMKSLFEVILKNRQDMHWVTGWVNQRYPQFAVTLKSFWGGSNPVHEDIMVLPAFTAEGKKQLDLFLSDMEAAVSDPVLITSRKAELVNWYRSSYLQAWHDFASSFALGQDRLKSYEEYKMGRRKWGTAGRILP
jgi:type VI secretion system protein ImpL